MNNNGLSQMFAILDERMAKLSDDERYYAAQQPLAFMSQQAKDATKMSRMATNIPRLAVTALAERLRVTGLTGAPELWNDWLANDLDQESALVHREALALGSAYVIVWGSGNKPTVSVESAHQVAVLRDPGTRQVTKAVKRWETGNETHAVLYEADKITRYKADRAGAVAGFSQVGPVIRNPLGIVPVVEFRNGDRLLGGGVSEMEDLKPLVDALNKILSDLMVGSEYYARPRRWATGVELAEDDEGNAVNPFPEGDRMMISEDPASNFGSLPAADLGSYEAAVRVLLGQIMAVSALPSHYVGISTNNPSSAEALRASEASLAARAAARQARFGRSWELVARLMAAIRSGGDPLTIDVRVTWADPGTRSVAQEADAVVKLHAAGLLPAEYALARLGYSEDEIVTMRTARRREAIEQAVKDVA